MPIVYSSPTQLQLVQVTYHIFKDIYIPSLDDALGWATWRAVGDGLYLLHLTSLGSSSHFHVVSIVAAYNFFHRHMDITEQILLNTIKNKDLRGRVAVKHRK